MRCSLIVLCSILSLQLFSQASLSYGRIQDLLIGIEETFNGEVYVISDTALYRNDIQNSGWIKVRGLAAYPGFRPTLIEADGLNLFIATEADGLWKKGPNGWTQYGLAQGLPSLSINDMSIASSGQVWLATDSGAAVLSGGTISVHTPFVDNNLSVIECVGNLVYAGNTSFNESIKIYDGTSWIPTPQSTLSRNSQRALEKAKNGTLISDNAGAISIFDNGQWTDLSALGGQRLITEGNNKAIFQVSNQELYSFDGLNVDTLNFVLGVSNGPMVEIREGFINGSTWIISRPFSNTSAVFLLDYNSEGNDVAYIGDSLVGALSSNGGLFDVVSDPFNNSKKGLRYGNRRLANYAGLCIGANTSNGLQVSVSHGKISGSDWFSGPVANSYDLSYLRKYNRVWRVTKAQINQHRIMHGQPGYITPQAISSWPGNGDVSNGEAQILAPFIDDNLNGIYEPNLGEVPDIRGREALYAISNDIRGERYSTSEGMGIEAHIMLYLPDTTNWNMARNTLLVHIELKARRGNISNAKVGLLGSLFAEPYYGEFGSDSQHQLVYHLRNSFRGGLNVLSLGDSLASVRFFTNAPAYPLPHSHPFTDAYAWQALNGRFADGTQVSVQNPNSSMMWDDYSLGYNFAPTKTKFQADWVHLWHSWSFLMDSQLMTLKDRDITESSTDCIDFGFVYQNSLQLGWGVSNQHTIDSLILRSMEVKDYFDREFNSCLGVGLSSVETFPILEQFSPYPNPTDGLVYIGRGIDTRVEVYSVQGVLMGEFNASAGQLNLSGLPTGVYFLQVETAQGLRMAKVILE